MIMPKGNSSYPVKLFYSYSHKDERLLQGLETHLSLLRKQGLIAEWHDRNISAGTEWKHQIDTHLDAADIILLLVSADFLASEYCYSIEMTRALQRHQAGEARVIPVLLREVDWHQAAFSYLQVLPSTGKPITNRAWHTRDEAFADVARGIRKIIEEMYIPQDEKTKESFTPSPTTHIKADASVTAPDQPGGPWAHVSNDPVSSIVDTGMVQQKKDELSLPAIFDLQEALQRRDLVLFIGSDLSRTLTGLPSRADLARSLARRHGLDESFSLAEVAQRVGQGGNRWTFTAFLREALDTTGKSPQAFHQRIATLVQTRQIETLVTISYDQLLEITLQQAGVKYNRVVSGSDVSFMRASHPTLIKLYGDILQLDTLVVTERDHFNLLRDRDREALLDEVRRAFRRNTLLFLGYNLSDPDFLFLFDQVAQGHFAHVAYAVWPGLHEADIHMWRDRGIAILDVDPLKILEVIK